MRTENNKNKAINYESIKMSMGVGTWRVRIYHFGSKKDWISRKVLENYRYFPGVFFLTEVKP